MDVPLEQFVIDCCNGRAIDLFAIGRILETFGPHKQLIECFCKKLLLPVSPSTGNRFTLEDVNQLLQKSRELETDNSLAKSLNSLLADSLQGQEQAKQLFLALVREQLNVREEIKAIDNLTLGEITFDKKDNVDVNGLLHYLNSQKLIDMLAERKCIPLIRAHYFVHRNWFDT